MLEDFPAAVVPLLYLLLYLKTSENLRKQGLVVRCTSNPPGGGGETFGRPTVWNSVRRMAGHFKLLKGF